MKVGIVLAILAVLLVRSPVSAVSNDTAQGLNSFQTILNIPELNLSSPKVVEVAFPGSVGIHEVSVVNAETNMPQAQTGSTTLEGPEYQITTSEGNGAFLQDNLATTFIDFGISTQVGSSSQATINFQFASPANTTGLDLEFGQYSQKPTYVTVFAKTSQGADIILLARSRFASNRLQFPNKFVTNISVSLEYDQPLRITEASVIQQGTTAKETLIRFLAKPGQSYQIYTSPDSDVRNLNEASGNLFFENQVITLQSSQLTSSANPSFTPRDTDNDSVADIQDNCDTVSNADQSDIDGDGLGDACEDTDYDGVIDKLDNCPEDSNYNQRDIDGDGLGDVCDNQESRFTEQYPWLPWVAMGGVATVIIVLVTMMVKNSEFKFDDLHKDTENETPDQS